MQKKKHSRLSLYSKKPGFDFRDFSKANKLTESQTETVGTVIVELRSTVGIQDDVSFLEKDSDSVWKAVSTRS